jgi:hypothetical protein
MFEMFVLIFSEYEHTTTISQRKYKFNGNFNNHYSDDQLYKFIDGHLIQAVIEDEGDDDHISTLPSDFVPAQSYGKNVMFFFVVFKYSVVVYHVARKRQITLYMK